MDKDFATVLRRLLTESETTPYRMAKNIGATSTAIYKLLEGSTPSWPMVVRIARALSVPLETFVTSDIDLPDPSAKPRGRGRPKKDA